MPNRILTACLDCGAISEKSRCPSCRRKRERERGSSTQRGYGAEWRKLRARILREEPTCQYAWQTKTAGVWVVQRYDLHRCLGPSEEVDHITPKAMGGTDDRSNLRAVCRFHNRSKGSKVA